MSGPGKRWLAPGLLALGFVAGLGVGRRGVGSASSHSDGAPPRTDASRPASATGHADEASKGTRSARDVRPVEIRIDPSSVKLADTTLKLEPLPPLHEPEVEATPLEVRARKAMDKAPEERYKRGSSGP